MVIELKPKWSKYRIDVDAGMVYHVTTAQKGKKIVEKLTKFKRFSDLNEAYKYISIVDNVPVWKLRTIAKKLEVEK